MKPIIKQGGLKKLFLQLQYITPPEACQSLILKLFK